MTVESGYKAVARKKRDQRDALIPKEWRIDVSQTSNTNVLDVPKTCGLLSLQELEITSHNDAVSICEKLRNGVYTVEEVVVAFCKRAAIAQQLTNCLTEIFFDEAIVRARQLDKQRLSGASLPPLFGLPISLKDSFNIPGKDSTIGMMCFVGVPSTEYSALPALLLDLGAVLYCKTNVPQTMMTADSDNNVFGRTLNPSNRTLTAGGSTGGEGALIALRGSIVGFGTDIAGSVRIPSVADGIYGFKPSADIVPFGGQQDPVPAGMPGIVPSAGPMTTSIRSANYLLETIIKAKPWRYDSACLHLPWVGASADHGFEGRLKIAVVHNDGLYTPTPPVRRTITQSAQRLRDAGHDVVEIDLPEVYEAFMTTLQLYSLDGCKHTTKLIEAGHEPLVPSVQKVGLANIPAVTLEQSFALNATRNRIQEIYRKLWVKHDLDALLLPGAPNTATPHDEWDPITYTCTWNFLDYPAVIIPTGRVLPTDLADGIENAKFGEEDIKNYQLYTGPEDYRNAPLCVQLVGMKQEDEKLAKVAVIVDDILNRSA